MILADRSEEEILNLLGTDPLPKFGPNSITDVKELIAQLKLVREQTMPSTTKSLLKAFVAWLYLLETLLLRFRPR